MPLILFVKHVFQPQYTTAGQVPGQQPVIQLPGGTVQPGNVIQAQVPSSQPTPVPMVTPQVPQYQWYQQVPSAVGSLAVSTPITQNTPMQGISGSTSYWTFVLSDCKNVNGHDLIVRKYNI